MAYRRSHFKPRGLGDSVTRALAVSAPRTRDPGPPPDPRHLTLSCPFLRLSSSGTQLPALDVMSNSAPRGFCFQRLGWHNDRIRIRCPPVEPATQPRPQDSGRADFNSDCLWLRHSSRMSRPVRLCQCSIPGLGDLLQPQLSPCSDGPHGPVGAVFIGFAGPDGTFKKRVDGPAARTRASMPIEPCPAPRVRSSRTTHVHPRRAVSESGGPCAVQVVPETLPG